MSPPRLTLGGGGGLPGWLPPGRLTWIRRLGGGGGCPAPIGWCALVRAGCVLREWGACSCPPAAWRPSHLYCEPLSSSLLPVHQPLGALQHLLGAEASPTPSIRLPETITRHPDTDGPKGPQQLTKTTGGYRGAWQFPRRDGLRQVSGMAVSPGEACPHGKVQSSVGARDSLSACTPPRGRG